MPLLACGQSQQCRAIEMGVRSRGDSSPERRKSEGTEANPALETAILVAGPALGNALKLQIVVQVEHNSIDIGSSCGTFSPEGSSAHRLQFLPAHIRCAPDAQHDASQEAGSPTYRQPPSRRRLAGQTIRHYNAWSFLNGSLRTSLPANPARQGQRTQGDLRQ